ncbi:MAG: hypothetical protein LBD60_00465, partial [Puniceicoccales bacterium]|nr:hypothetical protein [Puniceicoccales bacterium]
MGIRVDPKEYADGTLGKMAPDLLDPTDPRNNPFNPDKTFSFYEVEMNIAEGANVPMSKPDFIKNPGSVPSAISMGISEPPTFYPPDVTQGVVNDLFPSITEPVIEGLPRPRESAIDRDYTKNIGALPTLVLHPLDETLTAADGPGYSTLEFKTKKPDIPNPVNYTWDNPETDERGLSKTNVEWLTFLSHDTFFSNTGYQLDDTQFLNVNTSLRERLTNPEIQKQDSVWKSTTEDFLREIVFAPDLPTSGGSNPLSWAEIVAYVNYYMVKNHLGTQFIYVNDDKISLEDDATDVEKRDGIQSVPLYYLRDLIAEKTSTLLYKDKISAIDLADQTIAYNLRKLLGTFFVKKVNGTDSETVADALCRDLLMVGVSAALKSLQSHADILDGETNEEIDNRIKEKISEKIEAYLNGNNDGVSVTYSGSNNVRNLAGQVFDDFVSKGYFGATDKDNTLDSMRNEIRELFLSLVGDLVLKEARKYKLRCQISQIDHYLSKESYDQISGGIKFTDIGEPLTGDQFQTLQKALKYVKSQLILLKNENHLPAELTVDGLITDYKPLAESNSTFENVTNYLNGDAFAIKRYVDQRVRESIKQAVHTTLVSELKASKVRDEIKAIFPMVNNAAQGEREKLRYALSGNFLPDLESYIVNRVLDATVLGQDNSSSSGDLLSSLINGSITNLPIKDWINEGLNLFLSGGADAATRKELEGKYVFIKDTTMRQHATVIIQKILKLDENYREDQSPLVAAIEKQISEETLVLAMKDKVEAQLRDLQSLIFGQKIATINGVQVSASNNETEKFLEYTYAKILKDHYEPIIYNDFVKFTKLLGGWFGTEKAKSSKSVSTLLMEKIEELRTNYGQYYDTIQSFPCRGEVCLFEDNTSHRHPKLNNQYDLFSSFFKADRSALNISALLADYIDVYEKYGVKCYRDSKKYDISDYSIELMHLLEKYTDLAGGDDIFAEAIFEGIRGEQIALKRELEAIDLFLEYKKAQEFKRQLNAYLLDETVAGWRSDTVKRQLLVNKIYSMAVDHEIMRTTDNGEYASGTVDTSIVSLNGEKEYDEEAGAYLYAKGIVEHVTKYNSNEDINIPVAEILNAIEAYKTADLYDKEELLSQFKRLLVSCEHIPYTDGTSLFSQLTKYISSDSIDFSLLTLFANVYPMIKSDTYVAKGVEDLAKSVLTHAAADIKAQMTAVHASVYALNSAFETFIDPSTSDHCDTLGTSLGGLVLATKTFDDGGGYAYTVNTFIDTYNELSTGLNGLVNPARNLITNLKNAGLATADGVFDNIQAELNAIRVKINSIYGGINLTQAGSITNETNLKNSINDLLTFLDHIEVAFFIEKEQKKYPTWYTARSGDDSPYNCLLEDLKVFASAGTSQEVILNKLIKFLETDEASYSLVDNFSISLLPLKGDYNLSDIGTIGDENYVRGILSSWEANGVNSLKEIFTNASYDPASKFEAYGANFNTLNTAIADLVGVTSAGGVTALTNAINNLQLISPLSSDFNISDETSIEKDQYVYLFNQVASAYNEAIGFLRGVEVANYLKIFDGTIGSPVDAIAAFEVMHNQLTALENKLEGDDYMGKIKSGTQFGTDPNNKLTDLGVTHGNEVLQWLVDALRQSKKTTLCNLLSAIVPSTWNTNFTNLDTLRTILKGFIDQEELGSTESRGFTITKADCLKLLDMIDRATYDGSTLSPVKYTDTSETGTLKDAVDGEVKTENPSAAELTPENCQYFTDAQRVPGPYFTNMPGVPRALNLGKLYDVIGNIIVSGEGPSEDITPVPAIDSRVDGGGGVIQRVDSTYDRSRWFVSQFTSAYNTIVSDFNLDGISPLSDSLAEAVASYKTDLTALTEAEAAEPSDPNNITAAKGKLLANYSANTGLYAKVKEILNPLNEVKTIIKELVSKEQDNLLTNGGINWSEISDDLSQDTDVKSITLNDQSFYIKKFKDITSETEFYVVQSGNGADRVKTFLTSSDGEKLQSLIAAEIELYQSFNNQMVVNIVDRLGDYNAGGYVVIDFLEKYIIDTTGNIFTNEFDAQIAALATGKDLSLLEMYQGVYAYEIKSKIDDADEVFQEFLDTSNTENFWQLAESYVFADVNDETEVTVKIVGELACSDTEAAKENYIKSLKTDIYNTLTKTDIGDDAAVPRLDTILADLRTAIEASTDRSVGSDKLKPLNDFFGDLLGKIEHATFSEKDQNVTLKADDTDLPNDITIIVTETDQKKLGVYIDQILANFRYQVVNGLKDAFKDANDQCTKAQLEAFKALLCAITATPDSTSVYLFSGDNSTNPYVFYDASETGDTKPGKKDLLVELLTEAATSLETKNSAIGSQSPANPASTYFLQRTGFDYDAWGNSEKSSIDEAIALFTDAFENVTYDVTGSITSYGTDLADWNAFWGQVDDENFPLCDKINAVYTGFSLDDDIKAFQYLFLQALDGTTNGNFSSSNVAQLRDILNAFDQYCLGIEASSDTDTEIIGFLQQTNDVGTESDTPLNKALAAETAGTISPEAYYTWNDTAITKINKELVKYPESETINPSVDIEDVANLSATYDEKYTDTYWQCVLDTYMYNLSNENAATIDTEDFVEALSALVESLQTNGYLATGATGYADQQNLFTSLQTQYAAICSAIDSPTWTMSETILSLEKLRDELEVDEEWIDVLTAANKIDSTGHTLSDDEKSAIEAKVKNLMVQQALPMKEKARYNIVNALVAPYEFDNKQVTLTLETIKSVLNDPKITAADATKIFDSLTHDIFKLLGVLDGDTIKIGNSGTESLSSILNSVSKVIEGYNEKLAGIFNASVKTKTELNAALLALQGCDLATVKSSVASALGDNESTANELQKKIIKDRLQNAEAILNSLGLLKEHVVLCTDANYAAYKTRVGANAMDESAWNGTLAGILYAIPNASPLGLDELKTFSERLNNLLGQEIADSNDVLDLDAAEAVENVLNCSTAIEKLLLLNVLQGKLGDGNGYLDASKKEIIQKFLYGEESPLGSEEVPYSGISVFKNDSATLTFDKVLTLSKQGGSGGISSAALLGDSVQNLSDLVDTNHVGTSLGGIFTEVPQEIEYVYNLSQVSNGLLGVGSGQNELLSALRDFSDGMFLVSPALADTAIIALQAIENLTFTDINKNSENHSMSVLVEAYNDMIGFFQSTLIKSGALTGAIQTAIDNFVVAYDADNPNAHATQKNALQTSLASAEGLLTIFEMVFNNADSTNAPAYREVLSMIHAQLRLKIDAKIQALKNNYSCVQNPASDQSIQPNTPYYISVLPITWSSDRIKTHNDYMDHLIENLYRFEALTYLGIFPKLSSSDTATREEIELLCPLFGHWEDLETSDDELCEKYLPADEVNALKTLLHKAYIAQSDTSGETLDAIFQSLYSKDSIGSVVLSNIKMNIDTNVKQGKFETFSKMFDHYKEEVEQCVRSLCDGFQKYIASGTIPQITSISKISLDKLLHDLNASDVPLLIIQKMEKFADVIDTSISALNGSLTSFEAEPTQANLDAINAAFEAIIIAINNPELTADLPSGDATKLQACLTEIQTVFEKVQPQCYLFLLEKLYPSLGKNESERTSLQTQYKTTFPTSTGQIDADSAEEIIKNINDYIEILFSNFGADETLSKYYAANTVSTFGDALLKNVYILQGNVDGAANANFQQLTNLRSNFKELNRLLWNVLKPPTNTTTQDAIDVLGALESVAKDVTAIGSDAQNAEREYNKLVDCYSAIRGKLTATGTGSLAKTLQILVDGGYKGEVQYEGTGICEAIKSTIDAINGEITEDKTIADMFRAFNTACFMIFLQKKYPNWNSSETELNSARAAYNVIFDAAETYTTYYTCGDDTNVRTLLEKIKPYQGDIKIIDSRPHYFEFDNQIMQGHSVSNTDWLYREPAERGGYIQYDVQQNKQYVYSNGQYFELVEQEVAFVQLSPEQHVRILAPNIIYEQISGNEKSNQTYVLTTDTVTQPISNSYKSYFVLGEDGNYYDIVRYHLKRKVYDRDVIRYIDLNNNDALCYRATLKEYAEVAARDLPDLQGPLANDQDYFIIGDEGQYYKADDVYTKYYYKEAELSDSASEEEKKTAEGTYYKIIGEVVEGSNKKYVLESGEQITCSSNEPANLFYRSTQNEQKFFGTKLYQKGTGEKYVTRDDPYLVVPVTYERYVSANENPEGFTAENKEVYVYSDVLKQYVLVGNSDEYYFTRDNKEYRIEFPDRRYAKQTVEGRDSYLYVPHPESKYKKEEGVTPITGDCIYTNGKYLPIKQNESINTEQESQPINTEQKFKLKTDSGITPSSDYVQARDEGYYSLNNVKIKTANGGETAYTNTFQRAPQTSLNGSYVYGTNGTYYKIKGTNAAHKLYADYQLSTDTDTCYVLEGTTLVAVENPVKLYAQRNTSYYEIKTVGAGEHVLANNIPLQQGDRYITISGSNEKIAQTEIEYVKKNGVNTYILIKDASGSLNIKKEISNAEGGIVGFYGIIVTSLSGAFTTKVEDTGLYKTNIPENLTITDWQPYVLEEATYNNLFINDTTNKQLICASENTGTATGFATPSKSTNGSYVHGEDGIYYDVTSIDTGAKKLYADYNLVSADGDWFVPQGSTLVSAEKGKVYAQYSGSYYQIHTVGDTAVSAGSKPLFPGNRYIVVSSNNIQIKEGEKEYVKLSGGNTYVAIKDTSGKVVVKKEVAVAGGVAGLDGMLVVGSSNAVVTEVKDKNLYTAKTVNVEGEDGQLYNLDNVVVSGVSGSGLALDNQGLSNIFVQNGTEFVRVSKPTEQYTVSENVNGNFVKIGDKYYDRRRDDITIKVNYKNEAEQICYRALDGNNSNIPFYLDAANNVRVKPDATGGNSGSGLFTQYTITADNLPIYTGLQGTATKAVRAGSQYYNLQDFQLVVKKNGKLTKFAGALTELKSSNNVYMTPYLVPVGEDLSTYDATKAIKVDQYKSIASGTATTDQLTALGKEFGTTKSDQELIDAHNKSLPDKYNSMNGKFETYTIETTTATTYTTSATANCYLKGTDNKLYSTTNLKISIDGSYSDFLGFAYLKKASIMQASLSSDNIFKNYEFAYRQSATNEVKEGYFLKGDDDQYYATQIRTTSQLCVGPAATTKITGVYAFKTGTGTGAVVIPNPTKFIYVDESNLGDRIKIGEEYVRKSDLYIGTDPKAKIQSFCIDAYGKSVTIDNLVSLYQVDANGNIFCYQIDTQTGKPEAYFGQDKKITIDGEAGCYTPDEEGTIVRAETTGYYKWSEVKSDPNFIKLRDVYYIKRDQNEEAYFVSSLATDTLYVYGTKYDFLGLATNGTAENSPILGDGLFYKYEGDFSTVNDDQYCNSGAIQLRGSDGKLYSKDALHQKGTQMRYISMKDLAMVTADGVEAPIRDVYIKPFGQTLEHVETLIDNIDSSSSRMLYGALGGKINEHLEAINGDLDTYGKAVAAYNRKNELGVVALQEHPEYRSDGGGALAEVFDEYTKRILISSNEEWLKYYRGLRDEVEAYKVSSEEQNIFLQRIALINTVLHNHFGDIVSHEEFFGGDLSLAVGKLVSAVKAKVTKNQNESDAAYATKIYETCYTLFEEMVVGLETLRLSWDLEDQTKEEEAKKAQGVDSVSVVSPQMNTLKEKLGEMVKKLKEITADRIKVIEGQVEVYSKIALLEYIYNNYGKIGNGIVFLEDNAQFKREKDKIAVQFVKLSTGEYALRLCDFVRSNGTNPLIGNEFLFRYNNAKGEIEKCVLDLASDLGSYSNNGWTAKNGSGITAYTETAPYLFTVKNSGEAGAGIECKWGKARSETDASEWGVNGIIFKDVQRHDALQNLFRHKASDGTISEGYIYTLAKAKLPKNDLMMNYVEQVTKNMEVPIYMARDRLCFFENSNYKTPAMIEMIQEKTQKLAEKPVSSFNPLQDTTVAFMDKTGLNDGDLH